MVLLSCTGSYKKIMNRLNSLGKLFKAEILKSLKTDKGQRLFCIFYTNFILMTCIYVIGSLIIWLVNTFIMIVISYWMLLLLPLHLHIILNNFWPQRKEVNHHNTMSPTPTPELCWLSWRMPCLMVLRDQRESKWMHYHHCSSTRDHQQAQLMLSFSLKLDWKGSRNQG